MCEVTIDSNVCSSKFYCLLIYIITHTRARARAISYMHVRTHQRRYQKKYRSSRVRDSYYFILLVKWAQVFLRLPFAFKNDFYAMSREQQICVLQGLFNLISSAKI